MKQALYQKFVNKLNTILLSFLRIIKMVSSVLVSIFTLLLSFHQLLDSLVASVFASRLGDRSWISLRGNILFQKYFRENMKWSRIIEMHVMNCDD